MFRLFKRKNLPGDFVSLLRRHYGDTVELITQLDEPFQPLYEAGLFVASIATVKILGFENKGDITLADEFNEKWLEYLALNPHEAVQPTVTELRDKLQTRFPVYRDLFLKILNEENNSTSNSPVQLIWELFTNCTHKEKPNNFIDLMAGAPVLIEIALAITNDIKK